MFFQTRRLGGIPANDQCLLGQLRHKILLFFFLFSFSASAKSLSNFSSSFTAQNRPRDQTPHPLDDSFGNPFLFYLSSVAG
jgi:hypothetical protein